MFNDDYLSPLRFPVDAGTPFEKVAVALAENQFLSITEGGAFLGVLSAADALLSSAPTAGGRLRPSTPVYLGRPLGDTIERLLSEQRPALAVYDGPGGEFRGLIVASELFPNLRRGCFGTATVSVERRVASDDAEAEKKRFLAELTRCTNEPLQRILSAARLMKSESASASQLLLCFTISAAVDQIHGTIDALADGRLASC